MNMPDAYTIKRYARLARSFSTWSADVDALTDAHAQHLSDCKAAGDRLDTFLERLS